METRQVPSFDEFLHLRSDEVANQVRSAGPQVCVFPVNGTRRWFVLEHGGGDQVNQDAVEAYLRASIQRQIELCEMLFDHGVATLLVPVLGPDLMERGDDYALQVGVGGLMHAAEDPHFLDFYKRRNVRVRFYGDYKVGLQNITYHDEIYNSLDRVMEQTAGNGGPRLFFGVFAHDPVQMIAKSSVEFFKANGQIPDKRALIESYYGEYISPANFFIGFDKFTTFDAPLLMTGEEDLYFSVSPSPYMTEKQLRSILYDHLYMRRVKEPEYSSLGREELDWLRDFYRSHQDVALGTGSLKSNIWIPIQPEKGPQP